MSAVVDASNQFTSWTLNMYCTSNTGSDHIDQLTLTALRVDTVTFQG
jgi:hypothetical protein